MSRSNSSAAPRRLFDPAFLLGAVAVLSVWLIVEISRDPAQVGAQTATVSGNLLIATGQIQGRGNADAVYIYDHGQKKIVCYQAQFNRFDVIAIRDCQYDWRVNQYPEAQNPTPEEVKKDLEAPKDKKKRS